MVREFIPLLPFAGLARVVVKSLEASEEWGSKTVKQVDKSDEKHSFCSTCRRGPAFARTAIASTILDRVFNYTDIELRVVGNGILDELRHCGTAR